MPAYEICVRCGERTAWVEMRTGLCRDCLPELGWIDITAQFIAGLFEIRPPHKTCKECGFQAGAYYFEEDLCKRCATYQRAQHRRRQHTSEPQPERLTLDGCFETLGIGKNSSPDDIKKAYRRQMMAYHPDKVSTLGPKLQKLAEEESKRINQAMEMLEKNGFMNRK